MEVDMNKFFESAWETIKVIGALIILGYIVNSCSSSSGPQYPGDHTNESAEYQADMSEQDTRNYDPASRYDSLPTDAPDTYEGLDPYGDTACNIKGNITFDGEKTISPDKNTTTPPK